MQSDYMFRIRGALCCWGNTFTIEHEYDTLSKIFEVIALVDEDLHDVV